MRSSCLNFLYLERKQLKIIFVLLDFILLNSKNKTVDTNGGIRKQDCCMLVIDWDYCY